MTKIAIETVGDEHLAVHTEEIVSARRAVALYDEISYRMYATFATFHPEMSVLNASAPLNAQLCAREHVKKQECCHQISSNTCFMFHTFPTFHVEISPLNADASLNMKLRGATKDDQRRLVLERGTPYLRNLSHLSNVPFIKVLVERRSNVEHVPVGAE